MTVFKRFSRGKKQQQQQQQQPQRTKKVRFMSDEDIDQIESYENEDEIWFSRNDESNFQLRDFRMSKLLQDMDPAVLELKTGESPRGLEHADDDYIHHINMRRTASLAAVMSTQKKFKLQKEDGSDCIARSYGLVSATAVRLAIARAQEDERFVLDHVRVEAEAIVAAASTGDVGRVFEKRCDRPSLLGRRPARRSLVAMAM